MTANPICVCYFFMKKFKFKAKSYANLDSHKSSFSLENFIKDTDWISSHAFLPLVHVLLRVKKRNGCHKRFTFKERHIFYSSHTDSYIYQYYANLLSDKYENYLKLNNFSDVPIAYRSLNGKCNIDFAKEAFSFLKNQKDAFVLVSDFHGFFDSLNHKILKKNLMKILDMPTGLSVDWYAVYKSLIHATFFDLDELAEYKGVKRKTLQYKDSRPKILLSQKEMRELKKSKLHKYEEIIESNDKSKIGIPQGTSISALFANGYMIEFDKKLSDYVNSVNGFYRRYSDDIILIVPYAEQENLCSIFEKEKRAVGLFISPKKTRRFRVQNGKIDEVILKNGESEDSRKIIEYLGFSYNGNKILIKAASLNKFYRKLDDRLYLLREIKNKTGKLLGIKKFYRAYTHLGEAARVRYIQHKKSKIENFKHSSFITYVNKSARIIGNLDIKHQVSKHWKHVENFLHNI